MITSNSSDMGICLINVYFGERPKWFPLFLKCCISNPGIDFILIGDQEYTEDCPKNIKQVKMGIIEFNLLATQKLNIPIKLKIAYKICDFKPLFGKLFEDYLSDYSFWGYCDNDIVFGNIDEFIMPEMLKKYDIINTYRGFLSGPFCLFKNQSRINLLYEKIFRYREILLEEKYVGIDENVQRNNLLGINVKKIRYYIPFLLNEILRNNNSITSLPEIRYQFQWYYKKRMIKDEVPVDMTEVIWQSIKKIGISVFCSELMFSSYYLERKRLKRWQINYQNNILYLFPGKGKIFGYHFRGSVLIHNYNIEEINPDDPYTITNNGVYKINK